MREGTKVAEIVKVSTADVERAQLLIKLNDYVGQPTSEAIRKIAAARPINEVHRTNGHARPAD